MKLAHEHLGVTLEPGGAVAMAAMISGAFAEQADIQTVCIILSGGNVDPSVFARALATLE